MPSSRRLRPDEIETLKKVFGSEVDYRKVRIHDNHWTSNIAGVGAFVFGNNIQLSGKYVGDRKILIHETAHVWQFQNKMKWNYFFSALNDHILARIDGHDPYDYSPVEGRKPWDEWGVARPIEYHP